ncbi:MAG: hypothetical protein ACKO5H_02125 [Candidatus Fonsibacter sp.]|jgi:uncharacterized protein YxeA
MKKILTILFSILFLATAAYAASCPALMKQYDEKVKSVKLDAAKAKQATDLRKQGEDLHKAGKHADSEKALKQALALIGVTVK